MNPRVGGGTSLHPSLCARRGWYFGTNPMWYRQYDLTRWTLPLSHLPVTPARGGKPSLIARRAAEPWESAGGDGASSPPSRGRRGREPDRL